MKHFAPPVEPKIAFEDQFSTHCHCLIERNLLRLSLLLDHKRRIGIWPTHRSNGGMRMQAFFEGSLQLGDTPSKDYFPNASYVGLQLDLPIRPARVSSNGGDVYLIFETSLIETMLEWQRHEVKVADEGIGYLQDHTGNGSEQHRLTIPAALFDRIAGGRHLLSIRCGAAQPMLIDDFELRKISVEGAEIKLGWS